MFEWVDRCPKIAYLVIFVQNVSVPHSQPVIKGIHLYELKPNKLVAEAEHGRTGFPKLLFFWMPQP
jgi:hypothetical protein